jgi:type IV pilus assembly protein PilF
MTLPEVQTRRIKTNICRDLLVIKMPLLVLSAVIVLLSGCAGNQADDSNQESNRRKAADYNTSLGLEYMSRGQYEVALGKLKKAIKEDPDYAPAHTVLAILYGRIGEQDLAGKHYSLAYEADSKDGDVNNNFGVYLCQAGQRDLAIEHFLKALNDPFYSSPMVALTNAGSCYLNSGELAEADKYFRRALNMEPEFPDALMMMARLNFEQDNYLIARAFMQRYEAVSIHEAASLLLAFRIEMASHDNKAANNYRLMLETSFPESEQATVVRRLSAE